MKLGCDWDDIIGEEFEKDYYLSLRRFLKQEYFSRTVYPDMYDIFTALKETGCDAAQSWIIGDNWTDLESAANGSITSVFVTYGYGTAKQAKADHIIDNFADLKALIS